MNRKMTAEEKKWQAQELNKRVNALNKASKTKNTK